MKDGLRKVRIHFEFVMASFARKLLSGLAQKSCKCVFTRCDLKSSPKNFSHSGIKSMKAVSFTVIQECVYEKLGLKPCFSIYERRRTRADARTAGAHFIFDFCLT